MTNRVQPGTIVDVLDVAGHFFGRGYYNPVSQICVRLLTHTPEPIDKQFFDRRLGAAIAYREKIRPGAEAVRLVFSESDYLPGLIVDRYGDCLAVQILTLGMELRKELILDLLVKHLSPRAIQERSEASTRSREGLGTRVGACYGEVPDEIVASDGNLRYLVDLYGQKTGFYLDQRDNRLATACLADNRRILDCFCHTGMFGIACARLGATSVLGVDSSSSALVLANRNAAINDVADVCQFIEANAFDFLRQAVEDDIRFDLVILDPPSFTKNKLRVEQALRGYKEINLRAMRLLNPGGILVTCSCSHHISPAMFQEVVTSAAADVGRQFRLLARRGQALDHPILLGMPETEYLKCLILEDDSWRGTGVPILSIPNVKGGSSASDAARALSP